MPHLTSRGYFCSQVYGSEPTIRLLLQYKFAQFLNHSDHLYWPFNMGPDSDRFIEANLLTFYQPQIHWEHVMTALKISR